MEINFNHKELSDMALFITKQVCETLDSGYVLIHYEQIKPMAKVILWISHASQEDVEHIPEDLLLEDLYYDLEDKNAFFVEKKDLSKYKYYMEQIESFVKAKEAENRSLVSNYVISIATNLSEFGNLMQGLDTEKIEANTIEILKGMLNK